MVRYQARWPIVSLSEETGQHIGLVNLSAAHHPGCAPLRKKHNAHAVAVIGGDESEFKRGGNHDNDDIISGEESANPMFD
jgi:hypothetical protein